MRGHAHAGGHGLAVQPVAVAHARFDGVAKGVAEVEDGAQAGFALVARDDAGLDLAASLHGVREGGGVAGAQLLHVAFEPGEELHVGDGAVLDNFGQPGGQLARGQGAQRAEVAHDGARLVEGANEVLALRMVDGGFAAHGRVHLRQQRGGHLHEADAAHVARGGKASHVAHDAAAERVNHALAVGAGLHQGVEDEGERVLRLVLLAVGQRNGAHAQVALRQLRRQPRGVERLHRRVGDDERLRALRHVLPHGGSAQQPLADEDGIAAFAQRNVHALHGGRSGCRGESGIGHAASVGATVLRCNKKESGLRKGRRCGSATKGAGARIIARHGHCDATR